MSYNNNEKKAGWRHLISEWLHHFKWHILVWPAFGFFTFVSQDYLWPLIQNINNPGSTPLGEYASAHPLRLAGVLVCLAIIGFAIKAWMIVRPILVREKQYAYMLEGIGLREFSSHDCDEKKRQDWDRCVSEIQGTRPTRICILGASGWETFGSPQSPMHILLRDFEGSISILLMKPGSYGFKKRTAELNKNEEAYRKEIADSIDYCRSLVVKYKKSIDIRLYEDEPIWKMIFSDRYLWLQYYDPKDDVDNTPVYTLQTRAQATDSSLYYPLVRVFLRRWNDAKSSDGFDYHHPKSLC